MAVPNSIDGGTKHLPNTFSRSQFLGVSGRFESMPPSNRLTMARRVQPLASLNLYQSNWKIKVSLTHKGTMRTYQNAKGEGCVFNVELTDEDGTQMKATMFNEVARKLYDKFHIGKVYYISKGTIKEANKQFKTVDNDYEMTLSQYSQVEEVVNESLVVPEKRFNFVPIDQLAPYVNTNTLVDVIGVVEYVAPTTTIRRKINQQLIPKRDITIVDETKKNIIVSLWNDNATSIGQDLLDMVNKSPIVAIKSLKVGQYQGVSLSTLPDSYIRINPDIPQCLKLRSWYDSEGKENFMACKLSCFTPIVKGQYRSMYFDRVTLHYITTNPSLGEDKQVFFNVRASMTFINPDQTISYEACKTCNKKVTKANGTSYWYILTAKFADASGEAWFSVFHEEAETLLGCSADELAKMKAHEDETNYNLQLQKAKWVPFLFRVSVAVTEYKNVKRQRINVIEITPIHFGAETTYFLDEIASMMKG